MKLTVHKMKSKEKQKRTGKKKQKKKKRKKKKMRPQKALLPTQAIKPKVLGAIGINKEIIRGGWVDLQIKKVEKDGAVIMGCGARGQQPREGFVLHWDCVCWCCADNECVVNLTECLEKRERVEVSAVRKDALWLGPLGRLEIWVDAIRAYTLLVVLG
jgi:hypothetical protein